MAQQIGDLIKQKQSLTKSQTSPEQSQQKQLANASSGGQLSTEVHQFTIEDKKSLAAGLGACLVVQRTYGKQGSDLQTMVNIFCGALKEYEPEKVIEAVQKWLTESDEFPTPNNIKQLIDPKPQFCRVTYMDISDRRRRGDFVSDDEVKYQKLYRNHMMKGL